jgi:hypothetical protein
MHRFLATVPQQHLDLIRSLHVTMIIPYIHLESAAIPEGLHITEQLKWQEVEIEWLRSCVALAKMTGLKNLELDFWNATHDEVVEEELVKGLSSVKVVDGGNFVIRVPWKEGNPMLMVEKMSLVGVRLERRRFGLEPVIDRAVAHGHLAPAPAEWWQVALAIVCCPCILLVCVGSGVKTLVKKARGR